VTGMFPATRVALKPTVVLFHRSYSLAGALAFVGGNPTVTRSLLNVPSIGKRRQRRVPDPVRRLAVITVSLIRAEISGSVREVLQKPLRRMVMVCG
jgi:hypothetical protein